jgi:hypothetical protein
MSGLSPVDSRATEVDLTVTKVWSVREAQRYINGELQESYKQSSFDSALGKPMVDLADYMAMRSALTARDEALASIRVFAQDCIENGHDRGQLANLYAIRDLCDSKGETK